MFLTRARNLFILIFISNEEEGNLDLLVNSLGKFTKLTTDKSVVDKGVLRLNSNRQKGSKIYEGHLDVGKATIYNMPFFTKILDGVAILTGNVSVLRRGFSSSGFYINFHYYDQELIIDGMRLYSIAQGITGDGVIDFKNSEFNLRGSVIPFYVLTDILRHIPLIGALIVGDKNDGFLAISYHARGSFEDPDISIQPLEILTPGFVKHIRESLRLSPQEKALLEAQKKQEK